MIRAWFALSLSKMKKLLLFLLRRKIESDPTNPLYLQAVRGVGYRLLVLT